jgi:hypothetical protein
METQNEAWESGVHGDFVRALVTAHEDVEGWEEAVEALDEAGAIEWGFHDMAQHAGEDWSSEGNDMYIRVDAIAAKTAPGALYDAESAQGRCCSGWVGHALQNTQGKLTSLFNELHSKEVHMLPAQTEKLRAIINGLWDEGIQPQLALGAFSEEELAEQLRRAVIDPAYVLALSDAMTSEHQARYFELANRFLILDDALQFAHASIERGPSWKSIDVDEESAQEDAGFVVGSHLTVIEAVQRSADESLELGPWIHMNPLRGRG